MSLDPVNPCQSDLHLQAEEPDKLYRMVELECRSNDRAVLDSYETFAVTAAKQLGVTVAEV